MATEWQRCISCAKEFDLSHVAYQCECGAMLEIARDQKIFSSISKEQLKQRRLSSAPLDVSGVWRFRELICNWSAGEAVTHPEGNTNLYQRVQIGKKYGIDNLWFKHEGENPTGSFKDRGMTVAVTQAKKLGFKAVCCASTGNTSASLAAYAGQAGLNAVVFIPEGKIAKGKLAQALGYGATCVAIKGDFDAAMHLVQEAASSEGLYIVNSINPFRPEGQKSIIFEILESLDYQAPDWIVVPGGNLGNTSAFGKALLEMHQAGWISNLPRIATVQAAGANPFYKSYLQQFKSLTALKADTVATAIRIGNPVNFAKAHRVITATNGVVEDVTDQEILAAKSDIDECGIGCEPASASSLAGVKKLKEKGIIKASDRVVCILTGHILKDSEAILANAVGAVVEFSGQRSDLTKIIKSLRDRSLPS